MVLFHLISRFPLLEAPKIFTFPPKKLSNWKRLHHVLAINLFALHKKELEWHRVYNTWCAAFRRMFPTFSLLRNAPEGLCRRQCVLVKGGTVIGIAKLQHPCLQCSRDLRALNTDRDTAPQFKNSRVQPNKTMLCKKKIFNLLFKN